MKRLFLGAAVVASSLTFAQQFGLKAGMNVSSLSKDSSLSDQKSKIGFNAGAFMNLPLAESFSIQPEVLYSQYGDKSIANSVSTVGSTTTTINSSYTNSLDYLAVPVMFQYKATPEFYLEAGPEFGFLLSAKAKGDTTTSTTNGSITTTSTSSGTTDIKDNLNGFNFGVGLGAGYFFTPQVGITARYVAGFTDIAKNRPSGSDAIKNNAFQVGLAFKFGK